MFHFSFPDYKDHDIVLNNCQQIKITSKFQKQIEISEFVWRKYKNTINNVKNTVDLIDITIKNKFTTANNKNKNIPLGLPNILIYLNNRHTGEQFVFEF